MPPLPAVNKVIRTALNQAIGDADVVNVFHWLYTGVGPTLDELTTWATTAIDSWADHVMPQLHNALTLNDIVATDLTSDTSPEATVIDVVPGGATGDGMATNVATVLSHKISRRYRGGHPRTYLCGMETQKLNTFQVWTDTWINTIQSAFNSFVTDAVASPPTGIGTISLVSVSYRSGGVMRDTPVVDPIISTVGQYRVCSQRRRLGQLLAE
jgi:hypothetical protein